MANIVGTTGNDNLTGTTGDDTINALTGFDTVDGGLGRDSLTVDYTAFSAYSGRQYSSIYAQAGSLSGTIESRVSNDFVNFKAIEQIDVRLGKADDLVLFYAIGPLNGAAVTVDAGAGRDALSWSTALTGDVTFNVADNGTVTTSVGGTFLGFERYWLSLGAGHHTIRTGADDDLVSLVGGTASIRTGAGNDAITLRDASAAIDAGEGLYDYVNLDLSSATYACVAVLNGLTGVGYAGARTGARTTLAGVELLDVSFGSGNDSVQLTSVSGGHFSTGDGDDAFSLKGANAVTLDAGAGYDRATIDLSGDESLTYVRLHSDETGGYDGSIGRVSVTGLERLDLKLGNAGNLVDLDAGSLGRGARISITSGSGTDAVFLDFSGVDKIKATVNAEGVFRAGNATLSGFELFNIIGSGGADTITGGAFGNVINGGEGNDAIRGGAAADTLLGGAGNDTITGLGGLDDLIGGDGDDTYYVNGTTGVTIEEDAGAGFDTLISSGDAFLYENLERLILTGTADFGTGNDAANVITGNAASNHLYGGLGNDTISGGDGSDFLYGQAGADLLIGGAGADLFIFDRLETSAERDTIKDFVVGSDLLMLDSSVFTALAGLASSNGSLQAGAFALGKQATTAGQHVIYDKATGALFYDADGVGGQAQVQIATLSTKPTLSVAEILVI